MTYSITIDPIPNKQPEMVFTREILLEKTGHQTLTEKQLASWIDVEYFSTRLIASMRTPLPSHFLRTPDINHLL